MKEEKSTYRDALTDLYYLMLDIQRIEKKLLHIKQEIGHAVEELIEKDLEVKQ